MAFLSCVTSALEGGKLWKGIGEFQKVGFKGTCISVKGEFPCATAIFAFLVIELYPWFQGQARDQGTLLSG